jgi:hypothetical protein
MLARYPRAIKEKMRYSFAGVKDPAPVLEISRRLEHCGSVRRIAQEASRKGLRVMFTNGAFTQDARVVAPDGSSKNFSIRALERALQSVEPDDF